VPSPLSVTEREGLGLATIQARKGVDATSVGGVLGVSAPIGPTWAGNAQLTLIGMGHGAWLAVCSKPEGEWPERLTHELIGLASVTDQSSAYCVLRLTGAGAGELLQRGVSIDLHPASFGPHSAVATVIEHIGVMGFELAVQRSYLSSLRHWIAVNSAS
jgi:methylglutamate dehydrogenase subunit D